MVPLQAKNVVLKFLELGAGAESPLVYLWNDV